jgi:hypothetical protein
MSQIQIQKLPPTIPKSPITYNQIKRTEVILNLRNEFYHSYNEVSPKLSNEMLEKVAIDILSKGLLAQFEAFFQEKPNKRLIDKLEPVLEEAINESEDALTRVWSTGYDDDWD